MMADVHDKGHVGSPIGRLAVQHALQGVIVGGPVQGIACQPFIVGGLDVFHGMQKRRHVFYPDSRVFQAVIETGELLAGLDDIFHRPALGLGAAEDHLDHGLLTDVAFAPSLVIDGEGKPKQDFDHKNTPWNWLNINRWCVLYIRTTGDGICDGVQEIGAGGDGGCY